MSVLVSDIVTQVLDEIGDKDGNRTKREDVVRYYNRAQRVIATDTQALEVDAYFDLLEGEPRYAYPEDAVQMTKIRLSRTNAPTALGDYYKLDECFTEEFDADTYAGRSNGYIDQYLARNNWIEFPVNPAEDIADGGLMTYFKIPAKVLAESQGLTMELPDFLEDHVIEGCKIIARMGHLRERAAAQTDWEKWMLVGKGLKNVVQDRSQDRRASIRPPRSRNPFAGMR